MNNNKNNHKNQNQSKKGNFLVKYCFPLLTIFTALPFLKWQFHRAAKKQTSSFTIPLTISLNLNNARESSSSRKNSFLFSRMGITEQIIFARRLAILIKSGVSIVMALDILQQQSSSRGARKIINHLRDSVEQGQSLSKSMEKYPRVFNHFGVSIILVGETSGTLVQNLHYFADELKKGQELRRAIIGALIYPAFIMVATIGIVIMLTAYVFPKILPIFSSFKADLPWSTKVLISITAATQKYWLIYLITLLALVFITVILLRVPRIRLATDRLLLHLPIIGPMLQDYYIANFARTFSLLLKSELEIIQTLNIVGNTLGNFAYKQAFSQIAQKVARGESLSKNMTKDKLLFPPLVSQLVGVGEMTGNLDSSLMYLSEMYEDEMNNATKNLTTSIEPALMIFMGIFVGFIALAIITPIYGITQNLHQ